MTPPNPFNLNLMYLHHLGGGGKKAFKFNIMSWLWPALSSSYYWAGLAQGTLPQPPPYSFPAVPSLPF